MSRGAASMRLAILTSHVIQYQAPFFQRLAREPDVDLTVVYCSLAGATLMHDREMSTTMQWNLELLSGYRYVTLRNLRKDLSGGFFRLTNPGVIPHLIRKRYDAAIFMFGWGSLTALLAAFTCWLTRTPFFFFGDSSFPPPATTTRARIRDRFLRFLFSRATGFMTSGALNADYYRHYGADPRTFFLLPWAVDNDRFEAESRFVSGERDALRAQYGIAPDQIAFLYSAKLLPRKDPMTLLRGFEQMRERERAVIVFMGEGVLREELETYTREHGLERGVRFIGFVNQREIPKHYAMCDVFVLPSLYEPRGAVLNEAMACGLPVVVTDRCGSIGDIVRPNDNAFVYPAGDAGALASDLDRLAADDEMRARMAQRSREIIGGWSYERGVEGVKAMLQWLRTR